MTSRTIFENESSSTYSKSEPSAMTNSNLDNSNKEIDPNIFNILKDQGDLIKTHGDKINELTQAQNRTIESLGLFVALFTFISIEFKILENASKTVVFSLTFILSGILLLFVLMIDLFLNKDTHYNDKENIFWNLKYNKFFLLLISSIILIILGLISLFFLK